MLLNELINKYWLFKQISPLVDINLYFYYILYEVIRPRILRTPTIEEFINNHYIEGDNLNFYDREGIKFTSHVNQSVNYNFTFMLGLSNCFILRVVYVSGWLAVMCQLDFYNSLIDKNKICVDNKFSDHIQYVRDDFNIL